MPGTLWLGGHTRSRHQLSLLFGASVYTFSLILAVFLGGLGIGGLIGGKKGALIGAAVGGGAATIYESTKR